LYDVLENATVLGIDTSESMLAKSAAFVCDGCSTRLQDLQDIEGDYDLIFSNAALQWCPNHAELVANIWQHLRPGGQLLVQMPKNQDHASHRLAASCAHDLYPDIFPLIQGERSSWVLEVEDYAQLLFQLGAQDITSVLKVYPHVLENADSVVEWVKGTLLIPILERLDSDQQRRFLGHFTHALRESLPGSPVFYGFKRILFSARKALTS